MTVDAALRGLRAKRVLDELSVVEYLELTSVYGKSAVDDELVRRCVEECGDRTVLYRSLHKYLERHNLEEETGRRLVRRELVSLVTGSPVVSSTVQAANILLAAIYRKNPDLRRLVLTEICLAISRSSSCCCNVRNVQQVLVAMEVQSNKAELLCLVEGLIEAAAFSPAATGATAAGTVCELVQLCGRHQQQQWEPAVFLKTFLGVSEKLQVESGWGNERLFRVHCEAVVAAWAGHKNVQQAVLQVARRAKLREASSTGAGSTGVRRIAVKTLGRILAVLDADADAEETGKGGGGSLRRALLETLLSCALGGSTGEGGRETGGAAVRQAAMESLRPVAGELLRDERSKQQLLLRMQSSVRSSGGNSCDSSLRKLLLAGLQGPPEPEAADPQLLFEVSLALLAGGASPADEAAALLRLWTRLVLRDVPTPAVHSGTEWFVKFCTFRATRESTGTEEECCWPSGVARAVWAFAVAHRSAPALRVLADHLLIRNSRKTQPQPRQGQGQGPGLEEVGAELRRSSGSSETATAGDSTRGDRYVEQLLRVLRGCSSEGGGDEREREERQRLVEEVLLPACLSGSRNGHVVAETARVLTQWLLENQQEGLLCALVDRHLQEMRSFADTRGAGTWGDLGRSLCIVCAVLETWDSAVLGQKVGSELTTLVLQALALAQDQTQTQTQTQTVQQALLWTVPLFLATHSGQWLRGGDGTGSAFLRLWERGLRSGCASTAGRAAEGMLYVLERASESELAGQSRTGGASEAMAPLCEALLDATEASWAQLDSPGCCVAKTLSVVRLLVREGVVHPGRATRVALGVLMAGVGAGEGEAGRVAAQLLWKVGERHWASAVLASLAPALRAAAATAQQPQQQQEQSLLFVWWRTWTGKLRRSEAGEVGRVLVREAAGAVGGGAVSILPILAMQLLCVLSGTALGREEREKLRVLVEEKLQAAVAALGGDEEDRSSGRGRLRVCMVLGWSRKFLRIPGETKLMSAEQVEREVERLAATAEATGEDACELWLRGDEQPTQQRPAATKKTKTKTKTPTRKKRRTLGLTRKEREADTDTEEETSDDEDDDWRR